MNRGIALMGHDYPPSWRAGIQARGTREGLVIKLPEGPTGLDLVQDLQDDIRHAGSFFQRGELIIDYGTRSPDLEEISAFDAMLRERGIRLLTVTAGTAANRDLLEQWGFRQPRRRVDQDTIDQESS